MDLTVFGTDPYSGRKRRSISDEPSVRLVICGTGLAGDLAFKTVFGPQTHTCTAVHDSLHQVCHEICCVVADRFLLLVVEFSEHVTHAVLYSCDEYRLYIYTL